MPLISRRRIPLSLKHMTQMPPTITTHNLRPLHPKRPIHMPRHSSGDSVKESRPSAPGFEFLVSGVQGCGAGGASVDAGGGVVFVVVAGEGGFGAFLAEDAELFCRIRS